jgi:hypothetical protein
MSKIEFYGSICTKEHEELGSILNQWLGLEASLHIKIRMSGEEIVYEDATLYIYCFNDIDYEGVESSFLVEGHCARSMDECKVLLENLQQVCKDRNLESSFDYAEVNDDGERISEEFSIE